VRDVGGVWVSLEENLWLREFVRLTREKTTVDAATDARLSEYLALERQWLIEDFKKLPPDIVLVDNLRDGWGEWARADAELSQLLKPYTLVRSVEGVDILLRTE
jgi:predicted glycosyltransferase